MSQKRIAFQGEPGANSHLAIHEAYPDSEAVPCATFEDAFAAVSSGDCALGMIPIENSVAGRVADIHHLMPSSNLHIVGEYFMRVQHQLLGVKGATLKGIKTVESHVHALGQCRKIIRELGIKPIVAADTAGSAREIAERGDKTAAAIATRLAAEIYGLDILSENVEDETHNTTRFIILSREKKWTPSGNGKVVTTFVFRVRNVPAALYKALGGFATNGINMTKLESYMVEGSFFATQFYADVEGHPDDRGLTFAMEELAFFSKELKVLGVYPAHRFRDTFAEEEEVKIKANGIAFNYDISGPDNAPWLIFSNSLATSLHMWDPQADALKNEFRMLRYDQRGHGQTEAPAGRYTFDLLCADVIALMDALNIKRAHWCGVSMGCATGMGLVQKHPDRFDRMVLCDNPGRSSPESHKAWEERIAIAQKGGMPALLELTMQRWFPKETLDRNPPHLDKIRQMILTTPVNGFIGCSAALGDHDYRPLMPKVKNPVLYMTGEKDANNAEAMKVMQAELPGSQYIVLPGAGHISNMDQPEMFTKALRDFLR